MSYYNTKQLTKISFLISLGMILTVIVPVNGLIYLEINIITPNRGGETVSGFTNIEMTGFASIWEVGFTPFDNLSLQIFNAEMVEIITLCIPYNETELMELPGIHQFTFYSFEWNTCRHPNGKYLLLAGIWRGNQTSFFPSEHNNRTIFIENPLLDQVVGFPLPRFVYDLIVLSVLGIIMGGFALFFYRRKRLS